MSADRTHAADPSMLALTQQRGEIQLTLRNPEDIRILERVPAETSDGLIAAIRSGGLATRGEAP